MVNGLIYEVKEKIGVLKDFPNGWKKELNIVSWNEGEDKFDIRDWDKDHVHMSRGITLYESEAKVLYELLSKKFAS